MSHLLPSFLMGLFLLLPSAHAASWTPPIGIPPPPFGIHEVAPPTPNPWVTNDGLGHTFYYIKPCLNPHTDIDQTHTCTPNPAATDTNNPFGTPTKPRLHIPEGRIPSNGSVVLPAGAVVLIDGWYPYGHGAADKIQGAGTAELPVWIRGYNEQKFVQRNNWLVHGSYVIIENLLGLPGLSQTTGAGISLGVWSQIDSDHLVFRNSEVSGLLNVKSYGVSVSTPGGQGTHRLRYTVVYNNHFHHNGNYDITVSKVDVDAHCMSIVQYASYTWFLDNELDHCEGDGIQLNATNFPEGSLEYTFLGRNYFHDNKQAGAGTKYANKTVFSQNTSRHHRISGSAGGYCFYNMYGNTDTWYIFNDASDCVRGFRGSEDGNRTTPSDHWYIGNLVTNQHWFNDPYWLKTIPGITTPSVSYPFIAGHGQYGGCFNMVGGANNYRHILNNTCIDVEEGVTNTDSAGTWDVYGNIFHVINEPKGYIHVFPFIPAVLRSHMDYNLYGPEWQIDTHPIQWKPDVFKTWVGWTNTGNDLNSLYLVDPKLDANFVPVIDSPVRNAVTGIGKQKFDEAVAAYKAMFGEDIGMDMNRIPRGGNNPLSMGALEFNCPCAVRK